MSHLDCGITWDDSSMNKTENKKEDIWSIMTQGRGKGRGGRRVLQQAFLSWAYSKASCPSVYVLYGLGDFLPKVDYVIG